MNEVEDKTPVPDDAAEAATAAAEAAEVAATPQAVEVEIEETLTRRQVISRLRAVVIELKGGSLVVGGTPVAELGQSVEFELEYSERQGKHKLEIELKWHGDDGE